MFFAVFFLRIVTLEVVLLSLSRYACGVPALLATVVFPVIETILRPPPISAKMGPRQWVRVWKYLLIFSYLLAAGVFPIAIYLNRWVGGNLVVCGVSLVIKFSAASFSRFFISDPSK